MVRNNKQQRSIVFPIILMTSLMFVLLYSGWHLASKDFEDVAPIKNVEIEGSYENISLNDLRDKVVSVLKGGYFTVDLKAVRSALLELPWVEDASVRRQWPPALHIKVVEKQAVAYWGEAALLSDRGEVFSPKTIKRDKNLPRLNGPEGLHKKVWDFIAAIKNDFSNMGLEVEELTLDKRRAWTVSMISQTSENITLKLGREDAGNRLDRFVRVFSNNRDMSIDSVAVIDMRYPNGFAMRSRKTKAEQEV